MAGQDLDRSSLAQRRRKGRVRRKYALDRKPEMGGNPVEGIADPRGQRASSRRHLAGLIGLELAERPRVGNQPFQRIMFLEEDMEAARARIFLCRLALMRAPHRRRVRTRRFETRVPIGRERHGRESASVGQS